MGKEHKTQIPVRASQSDPVWAPEGPDWEHCLHRACWRVIPRPQQASQPLHELFWCYFSSICSLVTDKNPYTLKADFRLGWRHRFSALLPCPPSSQHCVQEPPCPYPVTEVEGSQQQERSRCGPVQPPVGLFQRFRF